MATPMYNTAWSTRSSAVRPSGQRLSVVARIGSWLWGGTPKYCGAGQPAPDTCESSWWCESTPKYATAPGSEAQASTQPNPREDPAADIVPRS
jgi:hypothetical protein